KSNKPDNVDVDKLIYYLKAFSNTEIYKDLSSLVELVPLLENDLKSLNYNIGTIKYLIQEHEIQVKKYEEEFQTNKNDIRKVVEITSAELEKWKPADDTNDEAAIEPQNRTA
ncbi:MAG: hypothetical protein KKE20_00875, partial [Nanoarchaeota archaeon]|nr:hypothetical protein [Nanoarchaeota archaeon]